MSYFLTNQKLNVAGVVELSGEEARHILLARRMKKGEVFNLQDIEENRYKVEIKSIEKNKLQIEVKDQIIVPKEPAVKITLFQSYVNEKALDFILQKSTELMASKIVLFNSQNTAIKLTKEVFEKKQDRWNKILWESAKQSDRAHPPELGFSKDIPQLRNEFVNYSKIYLTDASGGVSKFEFRNSKSQSNPLGLIVGPEGGFTEKEISEFKSLPNVAAVSLGPVLLRAETAALAALAILRNLSS